MGSSGTARMRRVKVANATADYLESSNRELRDENAALKKRLDAVLLDNDRLQARLAKSERKKAFAE